MTGGISVSVASATQQSITPGLHAKQLGGPEAVERAREGARRGAEHTRLPTRDEAEKARFSDDPTETSAVGGRGLSDKEKAAVEALKQRDAEIRAHEGAHLAAAGQFAMGGARFTYRLGPDNRLYAVHGEVRIDSSPIPGDPHATLQKSEVVRRAALAPANPSAADKAAAARADRMARAAREQIAEQQDAESKLQRGELDPLEAALMASAAPRGSDGSSLLPSPGEAEGAQAAGTPTFGGAGPMASAEAPVDPGGAAYNVTDALETYAVMASEAFNASACGSCKESCLCSRGYA
ncbi:MAG: hypothetical protein AMXMBFR64_08900 [Myxococcales bacterium]